jgi:hypothetical protein
MSSLSIDTAASANRFDPSRVLGAAQSQQVAELAQRQQRVQLTQADTFSRVGGNSPATDTVRRLGPTTNARYQPRVVNGERQTYCNVFTADYMRARGLNERQFPQQLANDTNRWLNSPAGRAQGWRQVSAQEAQNHVNQGGIGLVSRRNPSGHGHIAPIIEGQVTNGYPQISNVGSRNFVSGPANQSPAFRNANTQYWIRG